MNIAFFASSLLSAYWNGAATYYRGIVRALHQRGHQITFYEADAYDRQQHRDLPPPDWADVVVYENQAEAALQQLDSARYADMIVKASGIGVFDELLEAAVLEGKRPYQYIVFWDVDAPATLERIERSLYALAHPREKRGKSLAVRVSPHRPGVRAIQRCRSP